MRYFIDTEFSWDAAAGVLTPISIGLVAEDGREFYVVDANWRDSAGAVPPFVDGVVVPALSIDDPSFDPCFVHGERATIVRDLRVFIGDDYPEFWGDYSAFDYVVLSMLMGGFEDWPEGWPMHFNDLQQDAILSIQSEIPHNALIDARAVRDAWNHAFQVTS